MSTIYYARRFSLSTPVIICLLAALASGCDALQDYMHSNKPVAFMHASVVHPGSGEIEFDRTVITRDGNIVAVSSDDTALVPPDARVIDAAGRYLVPALTDMHVHIPKPMQDSDALPDSTRDTLFLYVAHGIATIRGTLGHPSHLRLRDEINRNDLLAPRILASGPPLTGIVAPDPAAARAEVMAQKEAGYDYIKILTGIDEPTFPAIVETAHTSGMPLTGHVPKAIGIDKGLAAGYALIDHLDGYLGGLVPNTIQPTAEALDFFAFGLTPLADTTHLPALVDKTRNAGTWMVPTQSLFRRILSDETPADAISTPEMAYMPPRTRQNWAKRKQHVMAGAYFNRATADKNLGLRCTIIKAMHDGGVGMLLGADSPQLLNVPGFATHHELAALVECGLTPLEALRTGTVNAARFLGREGKLGTITTGAEASLILVDANPLEDIGNLQHIAGMMLRGRWITKNQIDARLAGIRDTNREDGKN